MRQLRMHRRNLDAPAATYPDGYRFRPATWDDKAGLIAVLDPCFDDFGWNETKLSEQIFDHPRFIGCYVVDSPERVAAAVTGLIDVDDPSIGYVHFLGVHPDHRGHRLGRLILLDLIHVFRQHGLRSTILDTDDFRTPAIKTYIDLNFVPRIVEEGQEERWRKALAFLDSHERATILASTEK